MHLVLPSALVEALDRRTASRLWLSRKDTGKTPFQPEEEEEEETYPADVLEGQLPSNGTCSKMSSFYRFGPHLFAQAHEKRPLIGLKPLQL